MKKQNLIGSAILLVFAPRVFADELSDLRKQLDSQITLMHQMQQQIDHLEQQQKSLSQSAAPAPVVPARLPNNVITTGDLPNSIKIGNTSVALGGIIYSYGVYNSAAVGPNATLNDIFTVSTIPVGPLAPTTETAKLKFSAKPTRLFLRTLTPSDWGPVTTWFEMDFLGSAAGNEIATNGYNPRLRHAWATIGGFGFGQTWTNLANVSAFPENIDAQPTVGVWGGSTRQAQIRYTSQATAGGSYWAIAVENPETNLVGGVTQDNDKVPDLTGRVHFEFGKANFELSGAVRRLKVAPPASESSTGGGLAFSGSIPTFGKDVALLGAGYGNGVGRIWGTSAADAAVVGKELKNVHTVGGFVSYRHYWLTGLRSNLTYSRLSMLNPVGVVGTQDRLYWTTSLNLMWSPTKGVDVGLEYERGFRRIQNGQSGDDNRYVFGGRFFF